MTKPWNPFEETDPNAETTFYYAADDPSAMLIPQGQSVDQPTAHVSDKVTASTVGAAIIALVVAVMSRYGVEVDAVTATAVTPLAVLAAGWMMRERR